MNNLFFLILFVPLLAFVLLALNVLLAVHRPDESKVSAYECGFSPVYGQTRSTFQIHFFIIGLLFLVFDLEIILLFPYALTSYQVGIFGFSIAIVFFTILTIGFVFEIGSGAVSLINLEILNPNNNKNNNSNPLFKLSSKSIILQRRQYSTSSPIHSNFKLKSDFLNWFSGFTDAEGHFGIALLRKNEVSFRYVITLHADDLEVLKFIKSELSLLVGKEVGYITFSANKKYNRVTYSINSFNVIKELIIPIFNSFPLRTSKYLDFKDWEKGVLLKSIQTSSKLGNDTLSTILTLKKGMNTGRTLVENLVNQSDPINPHWLLGFCEGDSSFFIKESKLNPRFAISQNKKSLPIMKLISEFLLNLPIELPQNILILNKEFSFNGRLDYTKNYLYKNNDKIVFDISRINLLFFQVLPFFEKFEFFSRKGLDFQLWAILLKLRFFGYHNLKEGETLMENLAISMNNARYFNNNDSLFILIEKINYLLSTNSLELKTGLKLVGPITISIREKIIENYPIKEIYVYEDNNLLSGSPFRSINTVAKAINTTSQTQIKNLIDTGKVFKKRYTFYSKPLDEL